MGMRCSKLSILLGVLLLVGALVSGCRRAENGKTGKTAQPPQVITTDSGIEMVEIDGGWFEMGSDQGPSDENPLHKVWVNSFLMDRYEVTQEHYRMFEI